MIILAGKFFDAFVDPKGLVVSPKGDYVYVTDLGSVASSASPSVKRVSVATGEMSSLAGGRLRVTEPIDGVGTRAGFVSAYDAACDGDCRILYVADTAAVRRVDAASGESTNNVHTNQVGSQ
eukprot:1440363-Pyramimonas_sp.AAC.1